MGLQDHGQRDNKTTGTLEHRLTEMGEASRQITAAWGPERFAQGLKAAAECALRVGPVKPTLLRRMILQALLGK
jgi:hypothetical protein